MNVNFRMRLVSGGDSSLVGLFKGARESFCRSVMASSTKRNATKEKNLCVTNASSIPNESITVFGSVEDHRTINV